MILSKVKLLILQSDNSGFWKNCKVVGDKVHFSKKHEPEFTEGRSLFVVSIRFLLFFKRKIRLGIWVYGSKQLMTLDKKMTRILGSSWTSKELEDWIGKIVHLSVVSQKMFDKLEKYLIIILLVGSLVMNLLILRRVGF